SVMKGIPTLEQLQLSCDAPRRMQFWTLRVLLTTQSVVKGIPTLERAERDSCNYRADALRRHAVLDALRPRGHAECHEYIQALPPYIPDCLVATYSQSPLN
ncbi:hypothetical protein, partial [Pseudomonas syringae pv. coryli]